MKKNTTTTNNTDTIRKVKLPYNYLFRNTHITTPYLNILVKSDHVYKDIDLLIRLGLNIPYHKGNFRSGNKRLKLKNNLHYDFIVHIINDTVTITKLPRRRYDFSYLPVIPDTACPSFNATCDQHKYNPDACRTCPDLTQYLDSTT